MADNFYEILGVAETATIDEIKKSYRQLSLKYHPDRTQGDVEKSKKFQKINEAYGVLGDVDKKEEYDMSRKNPFMRMNSMGEGMNMDDLLSSLFFGGMHPGMQQQMHPGMQHPGMQMFHGFPQGANIKVFRNGVPVNMQEKPAPIIKTLIINMEIVLNGGKLPIEIERWVTENGNRVFETVTHYVDIFKGIDHNEIIVLRDQGNILNDTCKGDVKIFINVNNDTQFIRNGLDLIMKKEITLKEALCGFSFEIKYINGKIYTINNQAGNVIPHDYQKIIPNMGLGREEHTGNLIIHFNTKFPETLSMDKIDLIKNIL
jgi:DnaJ family protein A protein 2